MIKYFYFLFGEKTFCDSVILSTTSFHQKYLFFLRSPESEKNLLENNLNLKFYIRFNPTSKQNLSPSAYCDTNC